MLRRRIRAHRPDEAATFEPLERRAYLALVLWDGGGNGTAWEDPLNWSGDALPGPADDVVIDVPSTPAITLSSGNRSIRSLVLAESLTITGGSLAVATTASVTGAVTLNGGTIFGGSWDVTAGQFRAGASTQSILNAVTLNGDVVLPGGANLRITGGLTLGPAGRIRLTGAAANNLGFVGSQILASGVISLENTAGLGFVGAVGTGTLTIGPGAAITGGRGVVGQNVFSSGNAGLINQGAITATTGPITINTSGSGVFSNAGMLRAEGAGALSVLAANWSSTGGIQVATGAAVTLAGAWSSTGTMLNTGGDLNLAGTFTGASLAGLTNTGGQVFLTGTLNNAGATLTLSAAPGTLTLNGGVISGGTLDLSGPGALALTSNAANRLSGVTLRGDLLLPADAALRITGGLTLDPSARIRFTGANATLTLDGAQTVNGGEITFEHGKGSATLGLAGAGAVVLGPNLRIRGGGGVIGTAVGTPAPTLINQGTISADAPGTTLTIHATTSFTNSGTVEAAGGALAVQGTVTNYASGTLTGGVWRVRTGSTLNFAPGAITTNAATIELAGSAVFSALAGLATNQGSLTLADGRAFDFAPFGGVFRNAASGVLTKAGTGSITIPASIHLDSPGAVVVSGGTLTIAGPLAQLSGGTLSGGTWKAIGAGVLNLPGLVTTNAATIHLAGTGSIPSASALAINTGTLILGDDHTLNIAPLSGLFLNAPTGVVIKEGPGLALIPAGLTFSNLGEVRVTGGTLQIDAALTQLSGTTLTDGDWRIDAGVLELPGPVTVNQAAITIAGPAAAFPSVATLQVNEGELTIRGGGQLALADLANHGQITLTTGGLLTVSSTFVNDAQIAIIGAALRATGGGFWSGTIDLAQGAAAIFEGDHTFNPSARFTGPSGAISFGPGLVHSEALFKTGATVTIRGAAFTHAGELALTGAFELVTGEATLFADGGSIATLRLFGGLFTGGGTLTITHGLHWSGGDLDGNGLISLAQGSTSTIAGPNPKTLTRALDNHGTLTIAAAPLTIIGVTLTNQPGATLRLDASATISAGKQSAIVNRATLTKTGGDRTTIDAPLDNDGTVSVQSGSLALRAGGAHTGDFTIAAPGYLILAGDHDLAKTADIAGPGRFLAAHGTLTAAGAFNVTGAVTLAGAATFTGTFTAGPLTIEGSVTLPEAGAAAASVHHVGTLDLGPGRLTVSGGYIQTPIATLRLRITGNEPAQSGRIAATGAVSISGELDVSWAPGVYPPHNTIYDLITGATRTGQFIAATIQPLGPNRAALVDYTATAVRLIIRARIFEEP